MGRGPARRPAGPHRRRGLHGAGATPQRNRHGAFPGVARPVPGPHDAAAEGVRRSGNRPGRRRRFAIPGRSRPGYRRAFAADRQSDMGAAQRQWARRLPPRVARGARGRAPARQPGVPPRGGRGPLGAGLLRTGLRLDAGAERPRAHDDDPAARADQKSRQGEPAARSPDARGLTHGIHAPRSGRGSDPGLRRRPAAQLHAAHVGRHDELHRKLRGDPAVSQRRRELPERADALRLRPRAHAGSGVHAPAVRAGRAASTRRRHGVAGRRPRR